MPNWVYGNYVIKGSKKNILNFLNEGLKNSKCKKQKTCREAFDMLVENAKTMEALCGVERYDEKGNPIKGGIGYSHKLSLDTFLPIPKTFIEYDTTNYDKYFKNAAKYQKRRYGCIGWYDYGLMYRGTKWNAEIYGFDLFEDCETATIRFTTNTAWSYPHEWLESIKTMFDVDVLLYVREESGYFHFYGQLDVEQYDIEGIENKEDEPQKEDFENEDDFYEQHDLWYERQCEKMEECFEKYVNKSQ